MAEGLASVVDMIESVNEIGEQEESVVIDAEEIADETIDDEEIADASYLFEENDAEKRARDRVREMKNLAFIALSDAKKARANFVKAQSALEAAEKKMVSAEKYSLRLAALSEAQELECGYTATLTDNDLWRLEKLNMLDSMIGKVDFSDMYTNDERGFYAWLDDYNNEGLDD